MSMLAGLIGGVASTGQKMLEADREREARMADRMAEMDYASELEQKKQAALEQLKLDREEALRKRVQSEATKVEEEGAAIGDRRDAAGLLSLASTLPQGPMSGKMSDADMEVIRNMPAAARKIYEEAGGLQKETALTRLDDMQSAASKLGVHSSISEALKERRTAALNEIKAEFQQEKDRRQLEISETRANSDATRAEAALRSAAAAEARANAAGGSGSITREERIRYTSLLNETGRRLASAEKALATLRKDPAYRRAGSPVQEDAQALQEEIAALRSERTTYQSLLASGGESKKSDEASTKPAPATENKPSASAPPAHLLKEGVNTTFKGGQGTWTLKNGKPVQVK